MYPHPQYFAFLFAKLLFVLKLSCMTTMLMHFFGRRGGGGVLRQKRGAIFKRRTVGRVGRDLSCSRLLSSPLPVCTTLLLCNARGVSGTMHSLISMRHSRLETLHGVVSRYAFSTSIFLHFQLLFSKPPLTLVNKT